MGVELCGALAADGVFHQVEQRRHFLARVHAAAGAAVEVAEVDAGQQTVVRRDQLADLLRRAEHALLAHGLETDRAAGEVRLIERTQDVFYVRVRISHGAVARQLALTAAVDDHARCAERHGESGGLEYIADIFLHAFALLGGEVDEIRRMDAHADAVLLCRRADLQRGLLAAAHAAAALILEGGKAHLREPCGRVLAFLEAGGCEGVGISGRAETGLSHGVSPPFCAVRAQ